MLWTLGWEPKMPSGAAARPSVAPRPVHLPSSAPRRPCLLTGMAPPLALPTQGCVGGSVNTLPLAHPTPIPLPCSLPPEFLHLHGGNDDNSDLPCDLEQTFHFIQMGTSGFKVYKVFFCLLSCWFRVLILL